MTRPPDGYVGVVVADTRRAMEWEAGLRVAGFDAVRVETTGRDAEKGAWQICVPRAQRPEASALVTRVVRGDTSLPRRPFLSRSGWIALVAAVLTIVAVTIVATIAIRAGG